MTYRLIFLSFRDSCLLYKSEQMQLQLLLFRTFVITERRDTQVREFNVQSFWRLISQEEDDVHQDAVDSFNRNNNQLGQTNISVTMANS